MSGFRISIAASYFPLILDVHNGYGTKMALSSMATSVLFRGKSVGT